MGWQDLEYFPRDDAPVTKTVRLASPDELFEQRLERAAHGLCAARKIDPEQMVHYDNGTMGSASRPEWRPAWRSAAEELRSAWVLSLFVRSLG